MDVTTIQASARSYRDILSVRLEPIFPVPPAPARSKAPDPGKAAARKRQRAARRASRRAKA